MSTMEAIKGFQSVRLPRELVDLAVEIESEGVTFADALKLAADALPDLMFYALDWDNHALYQAVTL